MKFMQRLTYGLLILVFNWGILAAQELPENIKEVTTVSGITEYQTSNGMKVLLFPDSSSPKTTVNVTYLVGSRHEGYGESGMAHLLEHLLFKGSTGHTNVPQELSEHGANANGTTWYDRTNYYETFPTSEENLEWALSLESDRMVNSFVAKKDLDSEMTVVRNEFERGENSPSGILNERVFSTAYLWHNYGKSTIGARSDIENVPIENLKAFYQKYYQPDNAILIVAGKFDTPKTLQLISQTFGRIPRPERKLFATHTAEPTQDGQREIELRRTGEEKVVAVAYHVPAGSAADFAAVDVLGEVLSDTPSGRLYKRLVETKIATEVSGGAYQLHDPSLLYLEASARKDADLDKLEKALLETVHSFTSEPPSPEEVGRARDALLKNMEKTLRDSRRLALQLSEWAAMGDWRLFFLYRERLEQVTTEDVAAAAKTYLKESNRTIGRFVPVDSPDRTEVAKVDLDGLESALKDLKVADALSEGEVFDPTPDNIKARTTFFKLDDRIDVALLPKKTRGSSVNVSLSFQFGNEEAVQGKGTVAAFVGAMLMRGTASMTREQLKDALTSLSASGSVSGDYDSLSGSFSTTSENLPKVLELAADALRNPGFPQQELDTLRESYLASLEESKSDPGSLAGLKVGLALDPYPKSDPRATTTPDEDAAAAKLVTVEQLKQFHREFYGANRGQIAIVGDFNEEEIKALLERLVNWPNEKAPPHKRIEARVKTVDKGTVETAHIPDKANAVYYAVMKLPITDEHPDYAALRLANYILGGGFLNSRLATRVRQNEGLSYSIQSGLSANSLDPAGSFTVYAIAAPENIEKVKTAIREELEKALKDGFTDEEVEAAKKGYLESLKVARSQDSSLASLLTNYMFIKRDLNWLNDWDKKIEGLTAEELQSALQRHVDHGKLTIVTAGSIPAQK
jgi:zinc protease